MEEFKKMYPSRVTLCEDGVYRWSFDVDLSRDHYMRDLVMKIMLFICGSICLLMTIFTFSTGDLTFLWIPFACCGVVMLITVAVLWIFRVSQRDCYTLGFEMTEETIMLVQTPAVMRGMNTAAQVSSVLGSLAGKRGFSASAAAQPGPTRFRSIRSIREYPETSMLNLNTGIGSLQVWVCPEDYDMVRNYIQSHAASSPRYGRLLYWPKRLGLATLFSLAVNAVIGIINYTAFQSGGRLPISFTTVRNEVAYQNGIVMRTMFIVEGSTREEPWWMNRLEAQPDTAFLSFLVFTLIFFLILTVIHLVRDNNDGQSSGET